MLLKYSDSVYFSYHTYSYIHYLSLLLAIVLLLYFLLLFPTKHPRNPHPLLN